MVGISVIIPVLNREEFIGKAILSILDQNYEGPLEIVVSDDGSTDGSVEVAKSFGERITVVKKASDREPSGVSGARNRGLKVAKYPFICFLDSDDFYLPDHLSRASAALMENPQIDFVFCNTLMNKEVSGKEVYKRWTHNPVLPLDVIHPVVSRSFVVTTNAFMFRQEIFQKIGNFNEEYTNGEDSDMWMRVSEQSTGKYLNYFGAVYRINHGQGQLTKIDRDTINASSLRVFKDAIDRYYALGLRSQFRIFSLKRFYYYYRFEKRICIYRLISALLSIQYPLGFMQSIPLIFSGKRSRKRNKGWLPLSFFLEDEKKDIYVENAP